VNFPPKMEVFYWIVSGLSLNSVSMQIVVSSVTRPCSSKLVWLIVYSQVDTSVIALVIV